MVATASLELGIDIGDVELVCQLGTPRSISVFLQRVGRANHSVSGVPKGRIFPSSRDELVDCIALLDAVRRGELDRLHIPEHPLDVLSQQIVAEVAAREYGEDELFALVRRAWPYRNLAAQGLRRGGAHARRRHQHQARPARHLPASRCGQQGAAAAQGRAAHGHHLRRRHSGQRRLPGDPRAGRHLRRHAQRGLRHREPGRRHLPARQYLVSHPARGSRARCASRTPRVSRRPFPFWLGEAPARTDELSAAVVASARRHRGAAAGGDRAKLSRAPSTASRHAIYCRGPRRSSWWSTWPPPRPCSANYRRSIRWCSSASSTNPAACSSSSTRPFGARVNRAFGLQPAQEILPHLQLRAAGGGHRRRHRAVAGRDAQLRARAAWRVSSTARPSKTR